MFPVIVKSKARGRTYEYVHICESVWKNGRSHRRTIVSLGSKQLLNQHLDRIFELCRGHKPGEVEPIPLASFCIGPFLVLRRLWSQFHMPHLLGPISDRVLALVTNRLTRPASEHGLAAWLTTFFACDSLGRRFAPAYRSEEERKASRCPRVRVQAFQLQRWYRTLDALLPLKDAIEEHLFDHFRTLFQPNCDLVFYDLTSTYFQGAGPPQLARNGHSRDQRPRNRQILVGVTMVDGLPLSHTVFAGNLRDCTTVGEVVADVRKRFGLGRFVLVGDRGMRSAENVQALEQDGMGYLMALQGRRNPRMEAALQRAEQHKDQWEPCTDGNGKPKGDGTRVQEVTKKDEVAGEDSGTRRFLVYSPERQQHERKLRRKQQDKVRARFERLQERVAGGEFERAEERERKQLKQAGKQEKPRSAATRISELAGRILASNHGHRYYDWRLSGEQSLEFWENESCGQEKRREGHWLLETKEQGLTPAEAVHAYKDLWRVERAFRSMKDVLALRPVWHRAEDRVRAHVLVASLALVFDRILQRKLDQAGVELSSQRAWQAVEAVQLVEFELDKERVKSGVCVNGAANSEARQVLRAVGATLQAPKPPSQGERIIH